MPKPRVFIASLYTETSTFSPFPAGRETFEETLVFHGDATDHPPPLMTGILHDWRKRSEARGYDVVEGLCALAWPAGRVPRALYESYREEILQMIASATAGDMVLLLLHGAMVAEGYDDTEGDLLQRARALVGPDVVIAAELDLHCHLTDAMVTHADLLMIYQEYPHVDEESRGSELFELADRARRGEVRARMAYFDCRMIGLWGTFEQPMRGFVDSMRAAAGHDGVLDVALAHGFPWGDVADVGARMLAITDGDAGLAAEVACTFGQRFFAMRASIGQKYLGVDAALDTACAERKGPVVLGDVSDNGGGGAPNDSTFILRRVLERGLQGVAISSLWDPVAVRFCREAGVGGTLTLRMGGKCGPVSGDPVDLEVEVMAINPAAVTILAGASYPLGTAVWVRGAGVDIVLNTIRSQTFDPGVFSDLGLDPATRRILVIKSAHHFVDGFARVASRIIHVASPGAVDVDFAALPLTKRTTSYWPRVADPFAV